MSKMSWRAYRAAVALGAVALGLCVTSARARAEDAKPAAPSTFALLIGCTEYPELRKDCASPEVYRSKVRLDGCVNDVEAMTTVLVERLGVPRENIVTLAGWPDDPAARPTEANVRAALAALAQRTYQSGDRVIVHYSGHGVQQPDDDGDEADGLDEAWLLADGRKDPKTAFAGTIRDDELGKRLRAIRDRGALVWCLMDCCHSATGMRGASDPEVRTRGLDPGVVGLEVRPAAPKDAAVGHQDSPMDDARKGSDRLVVFYAAQSFQQVPEVKIPEHSAEGKSFGLLTSAVVRALRRCGDDATFEGLYEQVVAGYRELGKQNVVQPLAEGDLARPMSGAARALPPALYVRKAGAGLELSGGALAGLAEGTELEVFAPGAAGAGAAAIGRVVLTEVRAESSVVKPAPGSSAPWTEGAAGAWPAKVAKYVVGGTALPLAIVDAANRPVAFESLPEDVRTLLDDDAMKARFPREADPARAAWAVVVDDRHRPIALTPAMRGRAAPRFEADEASLEEKLLTVFRGENLLKLCARDPEGGKLPGNLELRVRRRGAHGESTPVRAGERVLPGTRLDFELVKGEVSSRTDFDTMDVYVFWIDPHFGVDMRFPVEDGDSPRLGRGDRTNVVGSKDGDVTADVSQGEERIIVFAAPALKDQPALRLEFLTTPPLRLSRGAPEAREGVNALLDDLGRGAQGARGVMKSVDRGSTRLYTKVLTFVTRWNALHAPPDAKDAPHARVERPPTVPAAGAPPDAWDLGPEVRLARVDDAGAWSMLVAREDGPTGATNVLIDLDDKGVDVAPTKEGLAKVVSERAFRAELAIRIEPATRRVLVWYDTDHDGTFDEVLIDADGDLRAEERFRLVQGAWVHEVGIDRPLLGTGELVWIGDDDLRAKIVERLHAVAGD